MITVLINGELREVPDGIQLDRLLELFSLPQKRVAVELNHSVIRRAEWSEVQMNDGDSIEVVYFVGGG